MELKYFSNKSLERSLKEEFGKSINFEKNKKQKPEISKPETFLENNYKITFVNNPNLNLNVSERIVSAGTFVDRYDTRISINYSESNEDHKSLVNFLETLGCIRQN